MLSRQAVKKPSPIRASPPLSRDNLSTWNQPACNSPQNPSSQNNHLKTLAGVLGAQFTSTDLSCILTRPLKDRRAFKNDTHDQPLRQSSQRRSAHTLSKPPKKAT